MNPRKGMRRINDMAVQVIAGASLLYILYQLIKVVIGWLNG